MTASPELPLRYWYQSAHLVVPAASAQRIGKALGRGSGPARRLLAGAGIEDAQIAAALSTRLDSVTRLLDEPRPAPVVVIDAEDGLPPGDDSHQQALAAIAEVFGAPNVPSATDASAEPAIGSFPHPLVFVRLPTLDEEVAESSAVEFLDGLVRVGAVTRLDGVILPKVGSAARVHRLIDRLTDVERAAGLADGRLRIMLMLESAAGFAALPAIAAAAEARLSGLILGVADYAADLGLPSTDLDHPVVLRARCALVEAAAMAEVPGIDGMTLAFPVADPELDRVANQVRLLERIARVFDEARHAFMLGLAGKWVGHPLQLFAVALARDEFFDETRIAAAARHLEGYRAAAAGGRGVAIVDGAMADRATARQASGVLRMAVAAGRFPTARALALGVVDAGEVAAAGAASLYESVSRRGEPE